MHLLVYDSESNAIVTCVYAISVSASVSVCACVLYRKLTGVCRHCHDASYNDTLRDMM